MEDFTKASAEVSNILKIINNIFLQRKLSKQNPMEASVIAPVKENYCHECFRESFRHVVGILIKIYIAP